MKALKIKNLALGLLLLSSCSSFGQTIERQVVGIAGGSVIISDGYVSVTVGETIIGTIGNDDGVLTQGFQQNAVGVVDGLSDLEKAPIIIYPNPVINKLYINDLGSVQYDEIRILDTQGKIVTKQTFPVHEISTARWHSGVYFLFIMREDKINYLPRRFVKIGN